MTAIRSIPNKSQSSSETRLVEVLDAYLAAAQEGRAPTREELLAAHPELAADLETCLASLEFIRQASLSASPLVGHPTAIEGDQGDSGLGDLGDFRILREVGRGGMGVVYEAVQRSLNRRVALKVLPFAAAMDPTQLRRFQTEALTAAQLHHTHIVPVYSVGCERGVHYYAMQFIEGQTLAQLIAERTWMEDGSATDAAARKGVSPTPSPSARSREFFRLVATLGIQAAEALDHAHKVGVVHRGIKPANLLMDREAHLWITDFGLARLQDDAGVTMTGDLLGTLRYMSPEQALAKRGYLDHRTDIYSLGVTLYELLTLRPAIDGRDRQEILASIAHDDPIPPRRIQPAIPRELDTILLKAMSKEPQSRYATAQELADDLRRFWEHRPIRARRPGLVERAAKWARRYRGVVAAAGIILILAVAGLALSTALIEQQRRQAITNLGIANQQRDLADARSRELAAAHEAQDRRLYIDRVNRAYGEWKENNLTLARRLLDECPRDRRGWEWSYCRRLCHLERMTLRGRGWPFRGLRFGPDGRWLITTANAVLFAGGDGEWTIWDATTGRAMESGPSPADVAAVDPGGSFVAVRKEVYGGSVVELWRLTKEEARRLAAAPPRLIGPPRNLFGDVAFGPRGRQLLTATNSGLAQDPHRCSLEVWDVDSGELRRRIDLGIELPLALDFSPDGQQVAAACVSGLVSLWDPETGNSLGTLRGHEKHVFDVAYSPDGRRLVSGGWDQTVRVWERATGRPIHVLRGHSSFVRTVGFSPDGSRIVSGSEDNTARLWDAWKGKELGIIRGHARFVTGVGFSPDAPDGRRIATASEDGTVKIWDESATELARTLPHDQWVWQVAFSPDGSTLASACWDRSVKLWNVADGRKIRTLPMPAYIVSAMAIRGDGRVIAAADEWATIRLWDMGTGRLLKEWHNEAGEAYGLAFHPDGVHLASTGPSGALRVWDSETGASSVFCRAAAGVKSTSVVYSPDGRRVAVAFTDFAVRILDTASGDERLWLEDLGTDSPDQRGVGRLAYDPSGRWIVACRNRGGRTPGEVRVFDAISGERIWTLTGHTSDVTSVTFSPDGRRIATSSWDMTVKLWETETGQEVFTLRGHPARPGRNQFRRDSPQRHRDHREESFDRFRRCNRLLF
jgi:WD40 repeat protein